MKKKQDKGRTEQKQYQKPLKKSFDPKEYQYFVNNQKHKPASQGSESGTESEYDSSIGSGSESFSDGSSVSDVPQKSKSKDCNRRKQEILIKLMALEKKGVELTKKFSMKSDLDDLEFEYELHRKTAETDAGVIFQSKKSPCGQQRAPQNHKKTFFNEKKAPAGNKELHKIIKNLFSMKKRLLRATKGSTKS